MSSRTHQAVSPFPVATPLHPASGQSLVEAIGNTPLVRLSRVTEGISPDVEVLAKAEWMNPGGSVKDRPALWMILDGERRGALSPGKTILDASSGNTAVAYAMIGAARGYRVKLCVPSNVDRMMIATLTAYGAEVVLTDPAQGMDGSTREVQKIFGSAPDRFFFPDQLNNPANWRAHYEGTANEIWRQSGGRVTHFLAGIGTAGTFVGTGRRLRELSPGVRLISVQPASPLHGLEGLRHLATTIVPGIYDPELGDGEIGVQTEEAQAMVKRLAREEGMLVGLSAGAAVVAAMATARTLERGCVVTVLPEAGRRFLGQQFWSAA
ncbi:MAG TPA: PLP-dependent cysteine synthase family protein [Spirochaetia bacterium]|nr:PLP-dependent cysteine synthase family protein [Spirochaetia bacterium]